jgi:glycosyltransferase involved in cell wall biosynthesis
LAVVIPCYRVKMHIMDVLAGIGSECSCIYVADDNCPEGTGELVRQACKDPRVKVVAHERNQGVGAATVTGYRHALADGADVIVKMDGDGQMDPALIPRLVRPILEGTADYAKGNRFYYLESLRRMPSVRLFGNSVLSFISKLSTGYWDILDPTNGFTAIHARVAEALPLEKVSPRYFFESDMLFRLATVRAVVVDVPMHARYAGERSNLRLGDVWPAFCAKHVSNLARRIGYGYFLRDFNFASIQLVVGGLLVGIGAKVGIGAWWRSFLTGIPATSGTVMLAALPVILGMQMLLSFLSFDLRNMPRTVLHRRLEPPTTEEPPPSG